jgi:hypothetical protein
MIADKQLVKAKSLERLTNVGSPLYPISFFIVLRRSAFEFGWVAHYV